MPATNPQPRSMRDCVDYIENQFGPQSDMDKDRIQWPEPIEESELNLLSANVASLPKLQEVMRKQIAEWDRQDRRLAEKE